jgi:diacylglycerol O-acyltransferase-1
MTETQVASPGRPRSFPLKANLNTNASGKVNGNGSGNGVIGGQSMSNGKATSGTSNKTETKYKHIAAAHYKSRSSVLSHDREVTPSFLGFRNLMIIVLGRDLES